MSSLRDLLDIATTDGIPVATYYGPQNAHQIYWRGGHCWYYESSHNYNWATYNWCVPSCCVCKVQFEVWGGGGGGGGSCCCMSGVNGYSGQYNKYTVCADQQGVNQLDNCCYTLCAGTITCRHPGNGGFDGCKSYVVGPGLDNFCACGGCHGYSCCFGGGSSRWGCQFRMNWQTGQPHCRWQCDKSAGQYSESRTNRDAACEFGREYWGQVGSYNQMDCQECGNWCMMKHSSPTAPYQDGKFGTFNHQRHHSMATCGRTETNWLAGNNGGLSSDCFRNGPPGHGGFSSDTFGGGCCCSSEGAAGLVKVTWFCKV
jgi:hypothetical protein